MSSNLSLQTHKYAKDVEKKREQYEHYNILPLYSVGLKPAIMELPEVVHSCLLVYNVAFLHSISKSLCDLVNVVF